MKSMARCALVALLVFPVSALSQTINWERAIAAFETSDAENPPPKNGILFVGSSSIRLWNTDTDFPEHNIINRGFGGSQTADVVQFMDRIVLPYEPRLIVVYAGENDIAFGKSLEQIVEDTQRFFDNVHAALPETRIVYISAKPSIARWNLVDSMRKLNAEIQRIAKGSPKIHYLDVDTPMLDTDGKPRPELFVADGLHLSEAGYRIWNELVRPHLGAAAGDSDS